MTTKEQQRLQKQLLDWYGAHGRDLPWRVGLTFFAALTGRSSAVPAPYAAQSPRHGQSPHRGLFGVQTPAPRSIIAWTKSPGRPAGTSGASTAAASFVNPGSGVWI